MRDPDDDAGMVGSRLGAARFHIGTQGWNYPAWIGPFYPRAARAADFLALYTRLFDSVEVDSTFYAVPARPAVENWAKRAPSGFTFALKFPREATHDLGLKGRAAADVRERFLERVQALGHRLGPVLVQLPPDFPPGKRKDLEAFLDPWPRTVRCAVEFRDPAWLDTDVWESLAARGVAPTLTDSPHLPLTRMLDLAARLGDRVMGGVEFVYVRWLGSRELTDYSRVQVDRAPELARWAAVLPPLLTRGIDVYGYFNNHYAGHSPASARTFLELIGEEPPDPSVLEPQGELF